MTVQEDGETQGVSQVIYDEDALLEMEKALFGTFNITTVDKHEIGSEEFVPFNTGVDEIRMNKKGPLHILDSDLLEPTFIHQEYILENSLRREANRIAHPENVMNRVVYDSQSKNPTPVAKEKTNGNLKIISELNDQIDELPSSKDCDNTEEFDSFYKPNGNTDFTL